MCMYNIAEINPVSLATLLKYFPRITFSQYFKKFKYFDTFQVF